jgi:hypothetical protein
MEKQQHRFGHAAWIWIMDMLGCWNADKKLSLALLVFRYFTMLRSAFRHHGQSGTASHGQRWAPAIFSLVRFRWSAI